MGGKRIFYWVFAAMALAVSLAAYTPQKPESKTGLRLQFIHYCGMEVLQLDSSVYKNELGQSYTVSMFKYYVSNIHLKRKDGKEYVSKDYFLVNEDETDSKQFQLNDVPEGEYQAISFVLGVDSLHNCSGAQAGALDPAKGMFWTWNTGYIFLKLEGHSPMSQSPGHIFEFHIGGYKEPVNCIRTISLNLKNTLLVTKEKNALLQIKADVSEIFKNPFSVDFSKMSSVTDFHNAGKIADNYTDMFSVL